MKTVTVNLKPHMIVRETLRCVRPADVEKAREVFDRLPSIATGLWPNLCHACGLDPDDEELGPSMASIGGWALGAYRPMGTIMLAGNLFDGAEVVFLCPILKAEPHPIGANLKGALERVDALTAKVQASHGPNRALALHKLADAVAAAIRLNASEGEPTAVPFEESTVAVEIDWTAGGPNPLTDAERDERQADVLMAYCQHGFPMCEAEYSALQTRLEAIANAGLENDSHPSPACVHASWGGRRWIGEEPV